MNRACDPKVGEYGVFSVEENVLWLDIPVNDPLAVSEIESLGNLSDYSKGILHAQKAFFAQAIPERFPRDIRSDEERNAVYVTRIVDWQNARVLEAGQCVDFTMESTRADGGRKLRPQNLDRDVASIAKVAREKHRGAAAMAESHDDFVATSEAGAAQIA
jgi:hypothetical protein